LSSGNLVLLKFISYSQSVVGHRIGRGVACIGRSELSLVAVRGLSVDYPRHQQNTGHFAISAKISPD
jgi:hypothetical protein